jgi:hypothetical protein
MPDLGKNWQIDDTPYTPPHTEVIRLTAELPDDNGTPVRLSTAYVVKDPDYAADSLAQAHLLTAAVDLKNALAGVLEVMRQCEHDFVDDEVYDAAVKAANDAIAKSEGRTRKAVNGSHS